MAIMRPPTRAGNRRKEPVRNVKYMVISPAPETLPQGVIRSARIAT